MRNSQKSRNLTPAAPEASVVTSSQPAPAEDETPPLHTQRFSITFAFLALLLAVALMMDPNLLGLIGLFLIWGLVVAISYLIVDDLRSLWRAFQGRSVTTKPSNDFPFVLISLVLSALVASFVSYKRIPGVNHSIVSQASITRNDRCKALPSMNNSVVGGVFSSDSGPGVLMDNSNGNTFAGAEVNGGLIMLNSNCNSFPGTVITAPLESGFGPRVTHGHGG